MNSKIIAIGWDVRGWRGKQQAVAVIRLDLSCDKLMPQWWVSDDFQFQNDEPLCLSSLINPALGDNCQSILQDVDRVVIGIDAPLAFPRDFIRLLNSSVLTDFTPPASEIENTLAYRDCERWIYQTHGKKPLSASFDKLGNGATLAMALCNGLRKEGYSVIPQDTDQANRSVIEVYPAIVKRETRRASAAIGIIHQLIPDDIEVGSDQYDAAICAIVAAVYAGAGAKLGLPGLVDFDSQLNRDEGWVYSFSPEFIRSPD